MNPLELQKQLSAKSWTYCQDRPSPELNCSCPQDLKKKGGWNLNDWLMPGRVLVSMFRLFPVSICVTPYMILDLCITHCTFSYDSGL